jgi:hypothetical protein
MQFAEYIRDLTNPERIMENLISELALSIVPE